MCWTRTVKNEWTNRFYLTDPWDHGLINYKLNSLCMRPSPSSWLCSAYKKTNLQRSNKALFLCLNEELKSKGLKLNQLAYAPLNSGKLNQQGHAISINYQCCNVFFPKQITLEDEYNSFSTCGLLGSREIWPGYLVISSPRLSLR